MRERKITCFLLIGFLLSMSNFKAQDVWLQSYFAPLSGCQLSSTQVVNVLVNNNSAVIIPSGSITVSYTVNGGGLTQQVLNTNLMAGASWNFSFDITADLSACQAYNMLVWVTYASDPNQNNDTLAWTVQNDCIVVPGTVLADDLVCQGNNSGTLVLDGWNHGTIANWEQSTNGGGIWTGIGNTLITYDYLNLTQNTIFRVEIDGGFCPDAYSGIATITVQAPPVAGEAQFDQTVCQGSTGNLELINHVGTIISWESSVNNGAVWNLLGEVGTNYSYPAISETTWYRVIIDGGVCPDAFSDIAIVTVDEPSQGGIILDDMDICLGDIVDLNIGGYVGNVLDWEYSLDNVIFQPLGFTGDNYIDNGLTQSTYYRAEVQNGVCPPEFSNTVFVEIHQPVVGGTILGSDDFCGVLGNGTLTLTGWTDQIIYWETSTNGGANWNIEPETSDVFNYSNVSTTTWYRVYVDGDYCPGVYSDTGIVTISFGSLAGVLFEDTAVCEGLTMDLVLMGYIGDIIQWESSVDGVLWSTIAVTDDEYTTDPMMVDTYYRVIVQSPGCNFDTSNIVLVQVNPLPNVTVGPNVNILLGENTTLSATSAFSGTWSPPSYLSSPFVPDPVAAPIVTTAYTYTVIDDEGCENSASTIVFVTDPTDPTDSTDVEIPYFHLDIKNVVTTNSDGYNDFWIIEGIENYPSCTVVVFDIYGREVFSSSHYMNDWDGSSSNKFLPNGTYFYVVVPNNTEFEFKGALTLLGND